MRRLTRAASLLFFLALTPVAALAQTAAPLCTANPNNTGILTGLANQFSTTTAPWMTTALGFAQDLFLALAAIEIAWSAITYVLQKDSLPDFVAALLLKILSIGFFFILLQPQYGPVWIGDIIASFSQAGSAIGGQPQLGPSDPSSIFNCGTGVGAAMLASVSQGVANSISVGGFPVLTPGNILPATVTLITAIICALGVVIAFAIIAGQLFVTLIESYIVVGAGVFMLGFTGSRWTLVFGEKYIGYAVSVGIKLFMIELIVGLGYALGQQWAALFTSNPAPETYIEVVGAALVFGFVAWQIPGLAASFMNGTPRMTLGSFVSAANAAAFNGLAVASAIGGAVAGTRSLASGAATTLRASDVEESAVRRAARVSDTSTVAPPTSPSARTAAAADAPRSREPSTTDSAPSTRGAASGAAYTPPRYAGVSAMPETGAARSHDDASDKSESDAGESHEDDSHEAATRETKSSEQSERAPQRGSDVKGDSTAANVVDAPVSDSQPSATNAGDSATAQHSVHASDDAPAVSDESNAGYGDGARSSSNRDTQRSSANGNRAAETTDAKPAENNAVGQNGTPENAEAAEPNTRAPDTAPPSPTSAADPSSGDDTARSADGRGTRPPSIGNMRRQSFRPPLIPDDSAEGGIHIRFNHPD